MDDRINDFYCTRCGNRGMSIARMKKQREPGHLKKLFCIYCNDSVNHAEIKAVGGKYTKQWFDREFKSGNFDVDGNRKLSFGDFRTWWYKQEEENE